MGITLLAIAGFVIGVILDRHNDALRVKRKAQDVVEWNLMQTYIESRAEEVAYCKERGGVPITEPLSQAKTPYFQWSFPPSAVNLVRCELPPMRVREKR